MVRQAPGYRLRVDSGELDLDVFEELLAQAHQASRNGDHELTSRTLREAEALWRGRPLANLNSKPFAQIECERLAEMRLVAAEDRIDAELSMGCHYQARARAGADGRRASIARARARSGDAGAVSLGPASRRARRLPDRHEPVWSTNWALSPDPR